MKHNTPRPGVNTPHVRVPRAALDLCNTIAAKGAVMDLYEWADDRRYKPLKMPSSDLQARWGMSARKVEALLSDLMEEGLIELSRPGTNRRARMIRVLKASEIGAAKPERSAERSAERSEMVSTETIKETGTQRGTQDGTPTHARVSDSRPQTPDTTTPLKPPQGGRASDEATSNPQTTLEGSTVDNSAEAVDKSTETTTTPQKPSKAPQKRTRKPDCLSVAEVIAVEIPAELASVEGYAEGFRQWCEVRPGKGWRQKPIQVERFHAKMLKAHRSGLDVIRGLNDAFDKGWKGISPSYLKPLEARPAVSGHASQTAEADTAWENVRAAMAHWGRRPPGQDWGFSDDPAEDRRYLAAIKGATYRDDTREAWAHLYNNIGHHERGPKLKRSFGYHWRIARRAEVAA